MPRPRPTERPATPPPVPPEPLELQCPECTQTVKVPRAELVEGQGVRCLHCGTDSEVTHDYDELTGRSRWILVDPLTDYDDEFG